MYCYSAHNLYKIMSDSIHPLSHRLLAVLNIFDLKALFAKGSRKSEEFKHFNVFFFVFLLAYNEQGLFWLKTSTLFYSTFLQC